MRIRVLLAATAMAAVLIPGAPAPVGAQERPDRVVMIMLPAVTWEDLRDHRPPAIGRHMSSIAAMSARTASRPPNPERGFLTLGAGSPSYVAIGDEIAHTAFAADDRFETGTAIEAAQRRMGEQVRGEIVQVSAAQLQEFQETRLYGAQVGALGDALSGAGIPRAVVTSADLAANPTPAQKRRAAVLAVMDHTGAVDHGTISGLLRQEPSAPYGVATDPEAFVEAAVTAMGAARVVALDAGETSRADEYLRTVARDHTERVRAEALARTDRIVSLLEPHLTERDVVMVVTPTGPVAPGFREYLAPIGTRGPGLAPGEAGWLSSPTTRRDGMVILADVAPTVLDLFGLARPDAMIGTPMRTSAPRDNGVEAMISLDVASSVREPFAASAYWALGIILSSLAILTFLAFLWNRERLYPYVVAVALFALAAYPSAHLIRAFEYWWLGVVGAHLALYGLAVLLAAAAWLVPGPRWAGAVALLLLTLVLYGVDVAMTGPLQVNGLFGHSPVVAGRFYGVSNPGYAILFSAALLGVTGLVELRGGSRLPIWAAIVFVVLLPITGLPDMGADFGGLLAGLPAVALTIALGRGLRIRWSGVLLVALAAGAVAVGLSFVDLLRPAEARTHLGRFAELIVAGNIGEIWMIVRRKGMSALLSLGYTRWTYLIPVGLAVLALLLWRPRGILRDVLPKRPVMAAGLWGTLAAGALGFAVNDSGISIPALTLAFTVPFLVLVAVDRVKPRVPPPV